ncbi:MAG: glycoside hydrolase family 2, partial [Duncaniella sp.]|nr:glycoside hydrolase family 2 [Duncaniella sp.]
MKIDSSLRCLLSTALFSISLNMVSAHVATTINDGWKFQFANDSIGVSVHLPHSWNEDAYHTRDYKRGTGIYTKSLMIPQNLSGKRIYLKFDGAANKSEVSINGTKVGSHIGGYSSHVMDVTPYVIPGCTHTLVVAVDNADKDIPPYSADFTFMGGLYRDAWLVYAGPVHFAFGDKKNLRVTTQVGHDGLCNASISGCINNASFKKSSADIIAVLQAPDGTQVATKTEKINLDPKNQLIPFKLSFDKLVGISLWSPESPALYSLELKLRVDDSEVDTARETIGFRTFGFDDSGRFLLNGKPYKLRGMCRHQDQRPMGIALTDEQHRRDIQLIKDLGANFIRISHYPQDDAVLEMCDRLGLIVWEEIPVIDYVPESDRFADNCEIMLREMIHDHYNHHSVAMWGYMNEILLRMPREKQDMTKARTLALAQRLERVLEQEDSTRMSTMAFHGSDVYHGAGLADITDVKGWNLYQGWYGGQFNGFEDFLSKQHREHPDHRLIVSEYGAGS